MPRPKSPDGPWVTIPVALREADVARVDAALGGKTRSEWGRAAMLAALDGAGGSIGPPHAEMATPGALARAATEAVERPAPAKAPEHRGRTASRRIVAEGQAERAAGPVVTTAAELAK